MKLTAEEMFKIACAYEYKGINPVKNMDDCVISIITARLQGLIDGLSKELPNPYPQEVFTPLTKDEWKIIHEKMLKELNIPIDRLSGDYMRRAREQVIAEVKAQIESEL